MDQPAEEQCQHVDKQRKVEFLVSAKQFHDGLIVRIGTNQVFN